MIIRLLRSYTLKTGKKMAAGSVFRRKRDEADEMIRNKTAIEYKGVFPPKKVKIKLKDLCQPQE